MGFFLKIKETYLQRVNEVRLFNKIAQKYNLMRIRQKLSFIAMQKQMTVSELFL